MAVTAILGAQWGDEGKGKIVDSLGQEVEVVARFQGGANAGHTVYINEKQFILHQVPSGILRPHIHCILGNGMVVDPIGLVEELELLSQEGINYQGRLHIARNLHLVTPLHKHLDRYQESRRGEMKIGTTGRGIGPAYMSKVSRRNLRMADLFDQDYVISFLEEELDAALQKEHIPLDITDEIRKLNQKLLKSCELISPMIEDTVTLLNSWVDQGKEVLIEGAQGTLLDIDHGTYPYVTSSNTTIGGIGTGLGISPRRIDKLVGVFKAYNTRVGSGPFPTEQDNRIGEYLRSAGGEYGATTGRPRRCGWFDAVLGRFACMVNRFDSIALTKLDVLNGLEKIKICVNYRNVREKYPLNLEQVEPEYIELDGWMEDLNDLTRFSQLPENARKYVNTIEELLNTPISIISTGVKRTELVLKD